MLSSLASVVLLLSLTSAQILPTPYPATCIPGYTAQSIAFIDTLPYPFTSVLPLLPTFATVDADGPPNVAAGQVSTPVLNGSATTPGTTRTYTWNEYNVTVVDTLQYFSLPAPAAAGQQQLPYEEVFTTGPFAVRNYQSPGNGSIALYTPYVSTVIAGICGGQATRFNRTVVFCTNETQFGYGIVTGLRAYASLSINLALGKSTGLDESFYTCAALPGTSIQKCANGPYSGTTGALIEGTFDAPSPVGFMMANVSMSGSGSTAGTANITSTVVSSGVSTASSGSAIAGGVGGSNGTAGAGTISSATAVVSTSGSTGIVGVGGGSVGASITTTKAVMGTGTGASGTTTASVVMQTVNAAPLLQGRPLLDAILLGPVAFIAMLI